MTSNLTLNPSPHGEGLDANPSTYSYRYGEIHTSPVISPSPHGEGQGVRLPLRLVTLLLFLVAFTFPLSAQDATSTPEPTPRPRPLPTETVPIGTGGVERYFGALIQGNVGLLRLVGDFSEAQAVFGERTYPFFRPSNENVLYALIVAPIDMQPRTYELQILASSVDGSLVTAITNVEVTAAGYIKQQFNVPTDRAYLINPEVERNEFARLDALVSPINPIKAWDVGGFQLPMNTDIVSEFGQYRILNATVQTRHTGWDQKAASGTPIYAMGAGIVVYANLLDIRGNYVMLDHGWGIYTGYAHFSQLGVAVGQTVVRGQLLGLSGNTGRSSGPHLHWEVNVSGEWIDGQTFIGLWLP